MKYISLIAIILLTTIFSSCSTLRGIFKTRDPWNGRYQHTSGRFELVFEHTIDEVTTVSQYELPRKEGQRARMTVFAIINQNTAVFKAPRESDCSVDFKAVDRGIMLSDFCHGTGEDEGLYKVIE